jgi:hypothetical protein
MDRPGVGDEAAISPQADHPRDAMRGCDEWHRISQTARNVRVDEQILELLSTSHSLGREPIADLSRP